MLLDVNVTFLLDALVGETVYVRVCVLPFCMLLEPERVMLVTACVTDTEQVAFTLEAALEVQVMVAYPGALHVT